MSDEVIRLVSPITMVVARDSPLQLDVQLVSPLVPNPVIDLTSDITKTVHIPSSVEVEDT